MKVLLFEWNAFMQRDVESALKKMNLDVEFISYEFEDWDKDDYFYYRFSDMINEKGFDVVFSLNFFPVVADVCNDKKIIYISWVYDSPMHIRRIDSVKYDTNRVFMFDRGQSEIMRLQGMKNVYHMPLAVNAERLEKTDLSDTSGNYTADIGFVGKMYTSDFDYLMKPLDKQQRLKIDNVIDIQRKKNDTYLLDELITDDLMSELNVTYSRCANDENYRVKKEEMIYSVGAQVTRLDRIEILSKLSEKYKTAIYTYDDTSMIPKIIHRECVKYYSEMPKVFRNSKINLNIALNVIKTGIPLRILDIMGAGGFVITSYKEEIAQNFVDGKEIVIYREIEELLEKVNYYLNHDEQRKKIAIEGFEKVKKEFSFEGQIKKIFHQSGFLL